jgi:hypothetical protein
MARERKTIPLFSVGCPLLRRFRSFVGLVGEPFGVQLPFPLITGASEEERLSFVKKFCGDLLERPRSHLWHRSIKRLGLDSRMSIAMSLFLFRKVLPSTAPSLTAYAKRMAQPSDEPDVGFLRFVETEVRKIFRKGWDKGRYESACLNATLPAKACRQLNYAGGGARMYGLKKRWDSHEAYVLEVLTRDAPFELCPSTVISVETGGKHRIVSKSDVNANLFRPLHTSMYNHLSQFRWLLRGDAKASSFKGFEWVDGEVFTSGDYESATDNLNGHLQRRLLDIILSQTSSVPQGILESAPQMLRSVLEVKNESGGMETYRQERGQLMGNLLSFPLLCLVNYLGFRYYCGNFPVRVNGDDIVFRAPLDASRRWMKGVAGCGLTLSLGKTMVNDRFFSLNSSMFKAHRKRIEVIPMIRSTAFGYRADSGGVETLAGRWKSFAPGFTGNRRTLLRVQFLLWNKPYILASRRSLSRGLGISVRKEELQKSHLWERECFYLSLPDGVEKPLPVKPSRLDQERKPVGWSLQVVEHMTKEVRAKAREAGPAFVACAWTSPEGLTELPTEKEWQQQVRQTGYSWLPQRVALTRKSRLLGLSAKNAGRFLRSKVVKYCSTTEDPICRVRECELKEIQKKYRRRVWLPDNFLTKGSLVTRPAGIAEAPRLVKESKEKEEDSWSGSVTTFSCKGKVVKIPQGGSDLYHGVSSLRVYRCGGLGYGPPPFYPRD